MDCIDEDFHNSDSSDDEAITKQPFRRLEFALSQVIQTAIPIHVQLLKDQSKVIELCILKDNQLQLHSEQIKAANTVRLLKSDLHQLEKINAQVRDEDSELFHRRIKIPARDVIEVLSEFMEVHSDVLQPFPIPETDDTNFTTQLKCDFGTNSTNECLDMLPAIIPYSSDCQSEKNLESSKASKHWSMLKKELLEVNELVRKFASFVFSQQDQINTVEGNVFQARENVREGTRHLKKAAVLKAATIPIVGAVIGGVLLGPIGVLAGFKLSGIAACAAGGGIVGYGAGCKVKAKRLQTCDIELKALSYPSKSLSFSTPELPLVIEKESKVNLKNKED